MSLFDSASLVVTPNGYKEDKLYSIKPTDGSGDLVVTRATTATRVNSAGLVEVVPYNLFTYSEQFDNAAWTKNAATISANSIAAPNGTLTADKLVEDTTNDAHYLDIRPTVNNSINTSSIYVKAAGRTKFQLREGSNGDLVTFDLSNPSGNITSVGNGWFRVWLSTTPAATTFIFQLRLLDNSGNLVYTGNGTSGLYVWGAQLVSGSSAKEYFPTTDRLNVPRIDYTNGSCPSILVEPQRTNLALRSQEFDNLTWTMFNGTVLANQTIAPDGTNTADKVTMGGAGSATLRQTISGVSNGTVVTFSLYIKQGSGVTAFLDISDTKSTVDITPTANWIRYTYSVAFNSTNNFIDIELRGTSGSAFCYIWGAQLEVGSYPTSYIPTVASSVTRNADVISKTGISSLIGQTEGTLFMDCKINALPLDGSFFGIQKTSSNFVIRFGSNGSVIYAQSYNGSTNLFYQTFSYTLGSRIKAAFAYKAGSYAFYINGVQIGTGSNATTIPTCDATMFNSLWGSFNDSLSFYSAAALWKTRLSNTELATLTTI